jgi:hypothetical protein
MDTENESLPTDERASVEQQTGNAPLVGQPVSPIPHLQRISRFLEDVRSTPGSNVTRIYGLSDCVIAVAFTLVIVNIRLPPELSVITYCNSALCLGTGSDRLDAPGHLVVRGQRTQAHR